MRLQVDGPVATLTLTRPGKHNSLTRLMWRELTAHVRSLRDRADVRVIAVRGDGQVFSSGADLPEVIEAAADPATAAAFCQEVATALATIAAAPQLTVALLAHHASGGGAEVALACDLRVAQRDVQFSVPVARMGMVPDRLTVRRLLALAGPGHTRALLFLARRYDADHCARVGLVEQVVPVGGLDQALDEIVRDLATTVPYSVTHTGTLLLDEEGVLQEDLVSEFVQSLLEGGVADHGRRHYAGLAASRDNPPGRQGLGSAAPV